MKIILESFPTTSELLLAVEKDIKCIKGITPYKAKKLYTSLQIAKELHRPKEPEFIRQPKDVYDLVSVDLRYLQQEHFICIFLNTKNRVISKETLAIGTLNATIVHPREVFKSALRHSSASIICVHNHPSEDSTPSPEDIELTKRLIVAGEMIGIGVLDHVVIGGDSFFSMREQDVI